MGKFFKKNTENSEKLKENNREMKKKSSKWREKFKKLQLITRIQKQCKIQIKFKEMAENFTN